MKTTLFQILFFCLIPVGIILLILSIRMIRKTFSGKVILEVSFATKKSSFVIAEAGSFSIWQKGPVFRKAPLDTFRPKIRNIYTHEEIALIPSIFRPNSNDGSTGRNELFRFSAPAGEYELELAEGSSVSMLERGIIKIFPLKKVDPAEYYIQIRESQPVWVILIGIPLIALSGFCIIGGLVMGILARQILAN